ncbi:MAG TPA: 50S ribosomal protein L18 [Planctomycetes bacterium]|nr:50S ribosomal protein L18 [Planctomycetota bacterium]
MTSTKKTHKARRGKALSLRKRLRNVSDRPRLSVCRSLTNISVQLIDDLQGKTLVAASSLEKDIKSASNSDSGGKLNKTDIAKKVGTLLGERAKKAGVSKVAFDRGPYKYHGRIKALADGAREAGLEF